MTKFKSFNDRIRKLERSLLRRNTEPYRGPPIPGSLRAAIGAVEGESLMEAIDRIAQERGVWDDYQ